MGELIKKLREKSPLLNPQTPATGGPSKANHSANWIYQKHLADQGLGAAPAEDAPAPTTGPTTGGGDGGGGSAPAGGIVETEDDRKRKLLAGSSTGLQI